MRRAETNNTKFMVEARADEARDVTEMIVAVFESHRLGRPVELPLKTRVNPLTLL